MRSSKRLSCVLSMLLFWIIFLSSTRSSCARKSLYETLGVAKDCTPTELKKAYRKACLRWHPDKKGGDETTFKEVNRAYDILSDESKRSLYDQYGETAVDGNGSVPPNAHQQPGGSSSFFSFQQQRGNGQQQQYGGSSFFDMNMNDIDLEQLFRGSSSRTQNNYGAGGINLDLSELLKQMAGGNPAAARFSAGGPSTRQSSRPTRKPYTLTCLCSLEELATGSTKKMKVNFPSVGARVYSINLQKGWKAGTKVKFNASKDGRFPPMTFVIQEKKHDLFQRKGDDLIYRYDLHSNQRQRNRQKSIKLELRLPNSEQWTKTLPLSSSFLRNGQTLTVTGKGMPIKGGPDRGNLIVEFYDSSISGNSSNSNHSQRHHHRSA